MPVKQIIVTLDNVPGKLSEVSDYLGENGINIIALSVVDTADVSAVRFVSNNPDKAVNVLTSHGYVIRVNDVLAVETPNHPGRIQRCSETSERGLDQCQLSLHLPRNRRKDRSDYGSG